MPSGWTYEVGLQNLLVGKVETGEEGGESGEERGNEGMMYSTDLAAVVVAAIMSLDPAQSRVLSVYDTGIASPSLVMETNIRRPTASSNVWMVGQQYLLSMMEQM